MGIDYGVQFFGSYFYVNLTAWNFEFRRGPSLVRYDLLKNNADHALYLPPFSFHGRINAIVFVFSPGAPLTHYIQRYAARDLFQLKFVWFRDQLALIR